MTSDVDFVLVTGNPGKLAEARRLSPFKMNAEPIDLPELQSLDLERVLEAKAEEAWNRLGRPLVVEETGLELEALNGFPGPLVKWMLQAIGAEGIARIAAAAEDTRATARCLLLFRDAERTIVAEGSTTGSLVLPARGGHGFGWDPVFQPAESERTYGEMSDSEKDAISHRGRAWRSLASRLSFP